MPQPPALAGLFRSFLYGSTSPCSSSRAYAGEGVVGRIAQHDQYFLVPLDVFGRVAFSSNSAHAMTFCLGPFGGSQPVRAFVR